MTKKTAVSIKDKYELIKKIVAEERHSVNGVFKVTGCKVELVWNIKGDRHEASLDFIQPK